MIRMYTSLIYWLVMGIYIYMVDNRWQQGILLSESPEGQLILDGNQTLSDQKNRFPLQVAVPNFVLWLLGCARLLE